ncbi:hypothetical protein GW933_02040 [Candidatus Falkowbacteria bacterium]|uniref:Uncharacterized protein n=1 Tax=Candidatus Buchananbacteria bacterium CG10_big_fil_rev_8_21_14_0_10_33_19 TaxID=1974525 RepID=A0A2H0W3U8_9BACT|nr:hypothetical protein [Candidatus Falkowbacteria bacterium]PIS06028.1 MAG: hypothetical protein COT80_04660 [Candidatus Buchananbacteria bacterium CG10_big_fil_rev_8_21_14_0_10_33_19]
MKRLSIFLAFVLICGTIFAQGNKISIDLNKLDPETAAQVLQAQKIASGEITPLEMADQAEKWTNIGVNIGTAISGACDQLGTQVNEFVKTPVGIMVVGIIIWKMVGEDVWSIIGGSLVWVVIGTFILRSYSYYHKADRIKNEDGSYSYVRRYKFAEASHGEVSWETVSAVCHVVIFLVISLICSLIVFG